MSRKPPKPRFYCTRCGSNEIDARNVGCPPGANPEGYACPMELRSPIRRFFMYRFGILLP